ncbi:YkgJ family cysteine cluster protein [Megalodesulfovibrio paquesii]
MSNCIRCGACCRDGGPALHRQDLALLTPDPGGVRPFLDISDLVTLRVGEPVRDQPAGGVTILAVEMVKIRGKGLAHGGDDWTCVFYDAAESACVRHPWRPWECRLQDCRNPGPLREAYAEERLTRFEIMPAGGRLASLAAMHEARCSVAEMARLALAFRRGDPAAEARLLGMLALDQSARSMLAEAGGSAAELFVLGRPLVGCLELFGLGLMAPSAPAVSRPAQEGVALVKTGLWRYPDPLGVPAPEPRPDEAVRA